MSRRGIVGGLAGLGGRAMRGTASVARTTGRGLVSRLADATRVRDAEDQPVPFWPTGPAQTIWEAEREYWRARWATDDEEESDVEREDE